MTNATHDGVYTLGGNRFLARKGQPLPEGAVMDADPGDEPEVEERAVKAAPENKAKAKAPENRSK